MALPIHQNPADDAKAVELAMKIMRLAKIARMAANSTIQTKRIRLELEPSSNRMMPRLIEDPMPKHHKDGGYALRHKVINASVWRLKPCR